MSAGYPGVGTFSYTLTVRALRPPVGGCRACSEPASHAVTLRANGHSWHTFTCYGHTLAGQAWTLRRAAEVVTEELAELELARHHSAELVGGP